MSGLLEQIVATGDYLAADERVTRELEVLRERFARVALEIGKARFAAPDGRTRAVEELPWYVMIGAPGSGKTTALLNSGLRFPLEAQDAGAPVPGIGGTRSCDWWFSDEAVLLDTAGRYTTQDSDRWADGMAWHGFLELLKRFRPQRPLNGALVTVSVLDLLLWSKPERARFAAHVRMRIAEMYAALDLRFPVYALVTKMDLLAGFAEFFGEMEPGPRSQVWGTTFSQEFDPVAIAALYAAEFTELEQRLGAEMLARLHEERDLQRRAAIYRFPQQFHAIGPLIGEFLAQAFGIQLNHRPPMLRGVYLSSGTQEGNPIDRVLAAMAHGFHLERAAPMVGRSTGKCFFITRLLREVVFAEAGLAQLERHAMRTAALPA